MKEAIGGTWIFQIVIVFILLFTGFMCLSINRSKAFSVKDQIIQAIQAHNGIDVGGVYNEEKQDAFYDIVEYLKNTSYRNTGNRPPAEKLGDDEVEYECWGRDGQHAKDNRATFCIAKMSTESEGYQEDDAYRELPPMAYYRVVVFYQLDIPVFHDLFNFTVVGDTKTMFGSDLK